jgi:aminoglycoside phosphotransferase (APT) family kinase protein
LHQPAPSTAPSNDYRGVPLRERASAVEERLQRLQTNTQAITPKIEALWERALAAPETTDTNWLHGDLHARNVLVDNGVITGVIDWGDLTSGDVATDLASVWILFADARARSDCLARYRASETRLARARGWAVFFGAILLDTGLVDDPRLVAIGKDTLKRLDSDA